MHTSSQQLGSHALTVIVGHYGSGKTNLALGVALQQKQEARQPLLIDLDVVNPYFRSTDYADFAEEHGFTVRGPVFGNSNLDAPSLSPGLDAAISHASSAAPVIVDVGGDDDGARALVRFTPSIESISNRLVVMVVNFNRPETSSIEGNLAIMQAITAQSGLALDGLVGNTHLAEQTSLQTVSASLGLLEELSQKSGLPVVAVTAPESLLSGETSLDPTTTQNNLHEAHALAEDVKALGACLVPLKRLVKTNWQ